MSESNQNSCSGIFIVNFKVNELVYTANRSNGMYNISQLFAASAKSRLKIYI